MQCSAAMDILFLMDGSYSVGKGGFERSRHFTIKLCQALDIRPDKVCAPVFFPYFLSSSSSPDSTLIQVRVGLIQFGSVPRLEFALDLHPTKPELMRHLKKITYRFVSLSQQTHSSYYHFDFHTTEVIE